MTAIPSISDFTDSATTEGEFKTALSGLHDYLTGLLGTAGTPPAAQAALGALLGAGVSTRTTTYTVVDADRGKIIACTGSFALNLTAAATLGAGFAIAVANVGSGTITVDPAGTETIDGAASYALPGNTTILIACTGSGWLIVGANPFNQISGTPSSSNFLRGDKTWAGISSANVTDALGYMPVPIDSGAGGVGSFILGIPATYGTIHYRGTAYAGSGIKVATIIITRSGEATTSVNLQFSSALSGTWRCLGDASLSTGTGDGGYWTTYGTSLYQRIS